MGKGSLTLLPDHRKYDLDYHFPDHIKTVALSMSGGVESTLLLLLLIDFYGAENIKVFSGAYAGRRSWESINARATTLRLNVGQHYSIPQSSPFMSPQDNLQMFKDAKKDHKFDGWFNGTNAKLYSEPGVTTQDVVDRLRNIGYYVPFVFLEKQHTIDLYRHINKEDELFKSYSCTSQSLIHCGDCACCIERVAGFVKLGKKDQATYEREWADMVRDCAR